MKFKRMTGAAIEQEACACGERGHAKVTFTLPDGEVLGKPKILCVGCYERMLADDAGRR
jgi:hypothetical protein